MFDKEKEKAENINSIYKPMKFEFRQSSRAAVRFTDEELLDDLKKVALSLNKRSLTQWEYDNSNLNRFKGATIGKRIGWNKAIEKAGLEISLRRGISEKELFKNLENVWLTLGRQPGRREMMQPLSKYSERPYAGNYGSWLNAVRAFVEYMNSDLEHNEEMSDFAQNENSVDAVIENRQKIKRVPSQRLRESDPLLDPVDPVKQNVLKRKTKRDPSGRLKVQVLIRDGNKCRLCGITVTGENIHFDHIIPWSKGGETVLENLQVLCAPHNLAKGNL